MTVRDGVRERGSFGGRARLGVDPGNEKRDPTVRVSFAILPAVLPSMFMRARVVLVLPVSPSPRDESQRVVESAVLDACAQKTHNLCSAIFRHLGGRGVQAKAAGALQAL
jgi:hypothetical protein